MKSLRHRLKRWKQQDREPEDVSHHFNGRRCITGCERIANMPLLKAIAYEWLCRNLGVRTLGEIMGGLNLHSSRFLLHALYSLYWENKIALSVDTTHAFVTADLTASLTVNQWLLDARKEQETNADHSTEGQQAASSASYSG